MAVDASKLRRRRSLGAPPTEGAPGIEEVEALIRVEDYRPLHPPLLDDALATRAAPLPELPPPPTSEPAAAARNRTGEVAVPQPEPPQEEDREASPRQATPSTMPRGRGGGDVPV